MSYCYHRNVRWRCPRVRPLCNLLAFSLDILCCNHLTDSLSNIHYPIVPVMESAPLPDIAAASGAIVELLPSTARMILLFLLQVPSMDRRPRRPTRLRRANAQKATLEMITVLMRITAAVSMDIVDLESSTAIPQPPMMAIAMVVAILTKLELVVVSPFIQCISSSFPTPICILVI